MPEAVKTQANPLHVGAGLSVDRALQQQTSDIPLITTMIEHERNNADGGALASVVCRKVDLNCSGTRRSRSAQCRRDPVFNISDDCTGSKRRRYLLARNRSCVRGRKFNLAFCLFCIVRLFSLLTAAFPSFIFSIKSSRCTCWTEHRTVYKVELNRMIGQLLSSNYRLFNAKVLQSGK